jgi:hypothetical protein
MWEMGYHYAAPLTLFVAFAAFDALPRLMEARWAWRLRLDRPARIAALLGLTALLVNGFAYRHRSNFMTWNHDYFLAADEAAAARAMVARVPRGVSVEAMNHVLAHLADRKEARFLQPVPRADALAFSLAQDDWKPQRGNVAPRHYRGLIKRLLKGPEYKLVFSEHRAVLFLRQGVVGAAVEPSEQLVAFLGGRR